MTYSQQTLNYHIYFIGLVLLIFVNQRILERSTVAGLGSAIHIFALQQFTQFGGGDTVRFPLVPFSLPHLTQLSHFWHCFVYSKLPQWHVTIWTAGGFVCDVLVTVPIAWSLYNTRTGFRS